MCLPTPPSWPKVPEIFNHYDCSLEMDWRWTMMEAKRPAGRLYSPLPKWPICGSFNLEIEFLLGCGRWYNCVKRAFSPILVHITEAFPSLFLH